LGGGRSVGPGPGQNRVGVDGGLREGDELGHGAQGLVEAVELILPATAPGGEAGIAIERAVQTAVVGEIHDVLLVVVD